jgi:hypothetical protein
MLRSIANSEHVRLVIPSSAFQTRNCIERGALRSEDLELALARIKSDLGQLRGPVQRSARETLRRRIAGRVKVAHLRYYLGAALLLALVGVAVNALLLQRERHPAPLFGLSAPKPPSAAPAPAPAPPPKPASAENTASPVPPPTALPPTRQADAPQSPPPPSDPIAELLAEENHSDGSHLILNAQTALAKLGYPVKPDGKEGAATEQALREFEKAHGLPSGAEITERLVKQLTAAARAGGH